MANAGGWEGELVQLQSARTADETRTLALFIAIGEEPTAMDVMRALGAVKVDALDQEQLRRLAENLDVVLQDMDKRHGLPDLLRPALGFAGAFWRARTQSKGSAEAVEAEMRDLLHGIKEHTAELPDDPDAPRPGLTERTGVSAIVVSYRTGEVLFDCLRALEADPDVEEIVLVDNGNPEEVRWRIDELTAGSSKVKATGGGVNRGFAAGVNLGAAQARGGRYLIINPDAILQPGSIAALEAARAHLAEPIVVGGKIFGSDGKEQRGARRRRLTLSSAAVTFLGMGWLRAFNPKFVGVNLSDEPAPPGPVTVGAVSGALMYVSRAGFDRLGGFDEGYFLHVEDLDLCRRAEAEGGSVIYTPLASALHHGASSDAPALAVERHKAAGLGRYFRKFAETPGERAAAALLAPAISLALIARSWFRRRV
jgi:GT2 family glycosyltransferase